MAETGPSTNMDMKEMERGARWNPASPVKLRWICKCIEQKIASYELGIFDFSGFCYLDMKKERIDIDTVICNCQEISLFDFF